MSTPIELKNSISSPEMPQSPIGQRLKILIEALGLKVRTFSQAIDVSETTTRNYLDRGSKPGAEYLEKIANSFSTANLHWLVTGVGEPILTSAGEPFIIYQKNNSGNSINGNQGTATQNNHHYTIADCEKERDAYKSERDQARSENTLLRQQLEMAQALIASKDETLTLLRAQHNRPN